MVRMMSLVPTEAGQRENRKASLISNIDGLAASVHLRLHFLLVQLAIPFDHRAFNGVFVAFAAGVRRLDAQTNAGCSPFDFN